MTLMLRDKCAVAFDRFGQAFAMGAHHIERVSFKELIFCSAILGISLICSLD